MYVPALKSSIWLLDPRPDHETFVELIEQAFQLSEASNTPVMVEFRIGSIGSLLSQPDQWTLFGTLRKPFRGTATFDGQRLTITGNTATGIRDFVAKGRAVEGLSVPQLSGSVVLELHDMETGEWHLQHLL